MMYLAIWDDCLHVKLLRELMQEAEAAPLAAEGAGAEPNDRRGRVRRGDILHRRGKVVTVRARLGEDPIAEPIGPLLRARGGTGAGR